ncbi:MAG: HAMP domain-containing sensor histidine kinase, partial [Gammaproteobacteria bacterium]
VRLLGCESVLCVPLTGAHTGALLLPEASPDNPELTMLARSVQQQLASYFNNKPAEGSADVALIQQQVRELVHEVNNPLAIIKNYLRVLTLKYPLDQSAKEEIGHIESEIDRVSRLLYSARQNITASNELAELDLNELVRSHHKWLVAAFNGREGLKLTFTQAAEPAVVMASPSLLVQILLNLVKNAAEALGDGGKIGLTIKRNVHLQGRLYVLLEVSDDGPGLESWQMQKLFQAGSTTKSGTHTGSGLAIVKKLVDELQGLISCHSDKNQGTTFSLLLPQVR